MVSFSCYYQKACSFPVDFFVIVLLLIWNLSRILQLFMFLSLKFRVESVGRIPCILINVVCLQGTQGTCQGSYLHIEGSWPHCNCRQQSFQLCITTSKWNSLYSIFCWASTRHPGAQICVIKNYNHIFPI